MKGLKVVLAVWAVVIMGMVGISWSIGRTPSEKDARLSDKEIEFAQERSVKVISIGENGYAQGTGTWINDTMILTEDHVVISTRTMVFSMDYSSLEPAILVSSDSLRDLAVIRIKDGASTSAVFSEEIPIGKYAVIVGNPAQGDFLAAKPQIIGITMMTTPMGYSREMIVVDGKDIYPGFSGGALFYKGKVIGIVELCSRVIPRCYAIPSKELLKEIPGLRS